jgi:hypothetical protein
LVVVISCPECGSPAEITDRCLLASTGGPVEHLVIQCMRRHHLRMPADLLPASPPPRPERSPVIRQLGTIPVR